MIGGDLARPGHGRSIGRVLLITPFEDHHAAVERKRPGSQDGGEAKGEDREHLAALSFNS